MKIIISPAKKMVTDDGLAWKALPVFLEQAEELKETIQRLPYEEATRPCGNATTRLRN